jgi:hypothetical protein
MTKNPYLNALFAALYIAAVASFLFYGTRQFEGVEETILIPIAMLSLFVLSALFMGLCFLYQPVQMFLDGQKKEAASLVMTSAVTFAGITLLAFAALLLFSPRHPKSIETREPVSETPAV